MILRGEKLGRFEEKIADVGLGKVSSYNASIGGGARNITCIAYLTGVTNNIRQAQTLAGTISQVIWGKK